MFWQMLTVTTITTIIIAIIATTGTHATITTIGEIEFLSRCRSNNRLKLRNKNARVYKLGHFYFLINSRLPIVV